MTTRPNGKPSPDDVSRVTRTALEMRRDYLMAEVRATESALAAMDKAEGRPIARRPGRPPGRPRRLPEPPRALEANA